MIALLFAAATVFALPPAAPAPAPVAHAPAAPAVPVAANVNFKIGAINKETGMIPMDFKIASPKGVAEINGEVHEEASPLLAPLKEYLQKHKPATGMGMKKALAIGGIATAGAIPAAFGTALLMNSDDGKKANEKADALAKQVDDLKQTVRDQQNASNDVAVETTRASRDAAERAQFVPAQPVQQVQPVQFPQSSVGIVA